MLTFISNVRFGSCIIFVHIRLLLCINPERRFVRRVVQTDDRQLYSDTQAAEAEIFPSHSLVRHLRTDRRKEEKDTTKHSNRRPGIVN